MKTVIVTGGTGFIGRHVVKRLVARGDEVLVTGREPAPPGSELLVADFQDLAATQVRGADLVIHLAAETDTRAPDARQWRVNCEDAAEFLRLCRESGVPKLVYASSCAVYGRAPTPFVESAALEPLNAYGAAKLGLDKLVRGWAVGLRPSNVFGPGEEHKGRSASYVAQMAHWTRRGVGFKLFRCQRDLLAVDDAADGFVAAERLPAGVYNLSSGVAAEYLSVAVELARKIGTIVQVSREPCDRPGEFQEYTCAAPLLLREALRAAGGDWAPHPWRERLAAYVAAGWPGPALGRALAEAGSS